MENARDGRELRVVVLFFPDGETKKSLWREIIPLLVEEVVAQRDCSKTMKQWLLLKPLFSLLHFCT